MDSSGCARLLVLVFAFFAPACVQQEDVPEIGRISPPGYEERYLPQSVLDEFSYLDDNRVVWTRCFVCDLDWDDLQINISNEMAKDNWTDTTSDWISTTKFEYWPDVLKEDYLAFYSSPSGLVHVSVVNLRRLRKLGGDIHTTGDYFIVTGYDDVNKYKEDEK